MSGTRLFLQSVAAPITIANDNSGAVLPTAQYLMGTSPAGAATSRSLTAIRPQMATFLSAPLSAPVGIIDTDILFAAGLGSSIRATHRFVAYAVRNGVVVAASPDNSNGCIDANADEAAPFTTRGRGRGVNGFGFHLDLLARDRLMIKIESFDPNGPNTNSLTATIQFGGTTLPELTSGATDFTHPGWIDFGKTLSFVGGSGFFL